jgi:hypothetical protein
MAVAGQTIAVRDIRPGTLRNILGHTGLTVDEFRRLL